MIKRNLLLALGVVSLQASAFAQTVNIPSAEFAAYIGTTVRGTAPNDGSPSGGANTIVNVPVTSNYVFNGLVNVASGDFTSNVAGSWREEISVALENSAYPGQKTFFNFFSGQTTYTTLSITAPVSRACHGSTVTAWAWNEAATLLTGAAISNGSQWTVECYEAYDDSATLADSFGSNISFTLPGSAITGPSATNLGTVTDSNPLSALGIVVPTASVRWYTFTLAESIDATDNEYISIYTGNTTEDTELGLYSSTGALLATDDDGAGATLQSHILFGATPGDTNAAGFDAPADGASLAPGTYYVAVAEYNTAFAGDWDVQSGTTADSLPIDLHITTGENPPPPAAPPGDIFFDGPVNFGGLVGDGFNTILTGINPLTEAKTMGTEVTVNRAILTSQGGATYASEPTLRIENDAWPGMYYDVKFSDTTGAYTVADIGPDVIRPWYLDGGNTNILPSGSAWNVECYETFNDLTGVDAIGHAISINFLSGGSGGSGLSGTLELGDTIATFANSLTRDINYVVKQGFSTIASGTITAHGMSTAFNIDTLSMVGPVSVTFSGSSFLTRIVNVTLTGSAQSMGTTLMRNGEAVESGEVDPVDLDNVVSNFGQQWPGGVGNPLADLNVNGEVDPIDIDIVISNFGQQDDLP